MPRDITVTFDDGTTHIYRGAPDAVTPDQVAQRAASEFGKQVTALDGGRSGGASPSIGQQIKQQAGNLVAGAVRGAGSIGATILYPIDKITDIVKGDRGPTMAGLVTGQQPKSRNQERREAMDAALREMGADTDSVAYQGGKLATEVAGTLGAGGAVANAAARVPGVAAAAPNLLTAIRTGGMSAGATTGLPNALVRAAGGAISGGASAGLVDPADAATGAAVGSALPAVAKTVGSVARGGGKAARLAGSEVTNLFKGDAARGADELMRALDLTPDQLPAVIAQLRGAPTLVDGAIPTVAQALNRPQASILERVVAAGPGGEKLRQAIVAQAEARMSALDRVAPVASEGAAQMRADTGTAIGRFAKAEEGAAGKNVSKMYESVDPNGQVRMQLPVDEMRAAADKYLGPGTFGANTDASTAVRTAQGLSKAPAAEAAPQPERWWRQAKQPQAQAEPRAATWQEVLNLRSSLGEAVTKAKNAGDRQATAALTQMKADIDQAIERVSKGGAQPGETFSAEAANQWIEANASHAAKMGRFHNGPQGEIFRTVDGQPARQGGEIASLFWGNRPGLAEDVQAFRKLVADNPSMLGQFRSMITTEGAATAAQGGTLGQRYVNWVRNMTPGLREAFSPAELQTIQSIARDVERAAAAAKLGMGPGSTTYQNVANALDAGLLGSPLAKALASRVPLLRSVAEPARAAMADSASKAKAMRLAELLADPEAAAAALSGQVRGQALSGNPLEQLFGARRPNALQLVAGPRPRDAVYRGLPVILANQDR